MGPRLPSGAVQARRVSPNCMKPNVTSCSELYQNLRPARGEATSLQKLPRGGPGKTGILIWLHGLGMSGSEFGNELEKGIPQRMPWLQLHYPDAPWRAVTYRDGEKLRAWFDLEALPVSTGIDHTGLDEAVSRVHELLRQAEEHGIPASRIVLAGFSQGGALALQAGLTYEHAVGGIAAFSSWLPGNLEKVAKHKATPIFMGHGDEDRAVPFQVGLASYKALKESGFKRIGFTKYRELSHMFGGDEFDELESFVLQEIPSVRKPCYMPLHTNKLGKTERKTSVDSTEAGSGSDSPPTTDDEAPGPARLRASSTDDEGPGPARVCASSSTDDECLGRARVRASSMDDERPGPAPLHHGASSNIQCISPDNARGPRRASPHASVVKSTSPVHGCTSPSSSRKATFQKQCGKGRIAAALSFFPPQAPITSTSAGSFLKAPRSSSVSYRIPSRCGVSPSCSQSQSMLGVAQSFSTTSCARSPSLVQNGTRSQNMSFSPAMRAVGPCRAPQSVKLVC